MTQIAVGEFPITLERKAIKNMYLRVCPDGTVRITAPRNMPQERIAAFARSRENWIRRQLQKQQPPPQSDYMEGDAFSLWGRSYPLELQPSSCGCRCELSDGRLILYVPEDSTREQRRAALDTLCRNQLCRYIDALRPSCEATVGRQAAEYRIRDMQTRWGSCSVSRRRIWLNLRLAQYDPVYLQYVMLHELTHLLEANHGPRFYAHMDTFCPGWQQLRQKLKQLPQNH